MIKFMKDAGWEG